MLFVDTSAWFAYFFPADPDHGRVRESLTSTRQRLVTTDYCIDETLTLLLVRGESQRAVAAGQAFFQGSIARLEFVDSNRVHGAWLLFQQRLSAGWSFTDRTSKIVIDDPAVKTALALDAHFHQFGITAGGLRQ